MFENKTKVTSITTLYRRKEELKNESLRVRMRMSETVKDMMSSDTVGNMISSPSMSANPFTQMISGGLRALAFRLLGMHKSPGFFKSIFYSLADRLLLMISPKIKDEIWSLIKKVSSKVSPDDNEKNDSRTD
ncbi:hypothetical protein [Halocola ammonii]